MKIKIRHMLNGGERELVFAERNEAVVKLAWPLVGVLQFDVITGEGVERDCRDWEITEEGRELLGLEEARGRGERGRQIDRVKAAANGGPSLDVPRRGKKVHPRQLPMFGQEPK